MTYCCKKIKDSGEREVFESGAVRDMQEGKGRCDLLPLDVLGKMYHMEFLSQMDGYVRTGDLAYLRTALEEIRSGEEISASAMILELAKHYEEGAKKYNERNWEKGIPLHSFVDSAVRHYLKLWSQEEDENHFIACVWNIVGAIWTHQNKPEMIDLPFFTEQPHLISEV